MREIEGADGGSTDLTWRELVNPDSDDNYGAVKDSDVVCFAMGKLDKLTPGRELRHILSLEFLAVG